MRKFGSSLTCTGSAYNGKRGYIYIGCFDRNSTEMKPSSMFIFTWDLHQQKIVNEVSVAQTDGFRIVNRLELFLESFPQEGNDDQIYLLGYDQGHTLQKQTRLSNQARVFFNVESGKLEFDTLVKVTMKGEEYDIIYDMFPYQNTLILSGRVKSATSILTLAQCKLDLSDNEIVCNPKYKGTPIVSGAVQVDGPNMRYNEIDIEEKTIKYYELEGEFSSSTWNKKLLHEMKDLGMPKLDEDHLWVRGFHASQWGGVIYYGSTDHVDPGVTFLDWGNELSFYDGHQISTVYDRDYVLLGVHGASKSMMLVRDEPLYLIEGGYYSGYNHILLKAADEDGTVEVRATLNVLETVFDVINIRNNIGTIELESHGSQLFRFKEEDIISGNGLNVEIKSENPDILSAVGYTQAPVRITWADHKVQPVGDYMFSHDKVLLKTQHNSLMWGTCSELSVDPITVQCTAVASVSMSTGFYLGKKMLTAPELIMTYTTNVGSEISQVVFMNDTGAHHVYKFKGIIHDIGLMRTDFFYYAFVLFENDRVEIWNLNLNDLTKFDKFLILSENTVGMEHFCPRAVSIPAGSRNEYDILSDCGFVGKNVHRMGLTYGVNHFNVPLSMHQSVKGFCSFKEEVVVSTYSEVFSISGGDTFNKWTVPMEDMDGGFSYEMHCLPTLDKVAYTAHGTKGLSNTLIEQYKVEKTINQGRRFPVLIDGV